MSTTTSRARVHVTPVTGLERSSRMLIACIGTTRMTSFTIGDSSFSIVAVIRPGVGRITIHRRREFHRATVLSWDVVGATLGTRQTPQIVWGSSLGTFYYFLLRRHARLVTSPIIVSHMGLGVSTFLYVN